MIGARVYFDGGARLLAAEDGAVSSFGGGKLALLHVLMLGTNFGLNSLGRRDLLRGIPIHYCGRINVNTRLLNLKSTGVQKFGWFRRALNHRGVSVGLRLQGLLKVLARLRRTHLVAGSALGPARQVLLYDRCLLSVSELLGRTDSRT